MKLTLSQEIAFAMLARPGEHTCTSVGSVLTGRQSAYGWQTSAREGGRTLHALRRLGLVQVDFKKRSNGQIYREVAQAVGADLWDWQTPHPPGFFAQYDRILTLPHAGSTFLVTQHGVPRNKIILVAHAECDIQQLLHREQGDTWGRYAGYAVVSDTLACSSLSLGITRVPVVLKQGIPCAAYDMPLPERLRTVGYAALMERTNEYAVEIKRGSLARKAATRAGLDFKIATGLTREQMPDFYRSVDALILSSLQEGGAMPPYEAAAAGRLVIGTPVGDFPRLCLEGMGVLGPLNDQPFEEFAVAELLKYKRDVTSFRLRCQGIKLSVQHNRDWAIVMPEWKKFIFDSCLAGK